MSEYWTEDRVAELRKLWGDGKSATDISRHFSGEVSRSAVIGKVHRLRLPERETVSKHTPKSRPVGGFNKPRLVEKPKQPAPQQSQAEGPDLPEDKLAIEKFNALPAREDAISFWEALDRGGRCKWIYGGEKHGPDSMCCGAPTERGGEAWKPYCSAHSRLAYVFGAAR
jgi:GcrA cell cycle regulator